jgi:hypothetical protein
MHCNLEILLTQRLISLSHNPQEVQADAVQGAFFGGQTVGVDPYYGPPAQQAAVEVQNLTSLT